MNPSNAHFFYLCMKYADPKLITIYATNKKHFGKPVVDG